jgi:hypothetical protein
MKKVAFIVPYFGKLPNYFQLFLNSCKLNGNFKWIIVTDDKTSYSWPQNVQKIDMSFEHLRQRIQSKFDFRIELSTPYKLCDYKPTYGYIFEDLIQDYPFWGYCDIDTIMGKLDNFLSFDFLNQYDKLFELGHMTIFKNTFENNRMFMKKIDGSFPYKEALTSKEIFVFDEVSERNSLSINDIFLQNGKNVFTADWSYNVSVTPTAFTQVVLKNRKFERQPREKNQVIIWDTQDGLRLYYTDSKEIHSIGLMYIHLQQRKMKVSANIDSRMIAIIPNEFVEIDSLPTTVAALTQMKKKNISFHRLRLIWKWKVEKKLKMFK